MRKIDIKTVIYLGVLTALEIVLNRFMSINAWNIKIGFNFVPIVIAAIMFGPIHAAIVAALGDFMGAILFPIGAYFPGFTLTAFITGAVFGLFLHKEQTLMRTVLSVCIVQLILGLLLNSYWISVLYGSPYGPLLATRIIQCAIIGPVQVLVIQLISRVMTTYGKRLFA